MPPRNRKASWLAAVTCVAAVPGLLALSGCASGPGTDIVSALAASRRAPAIPSEIRQRLLALANEVAKGAGDPDPEWISVVVSTREKAVRASSGDLVGGPDFPAYLITMKGNFTEDDVSVPPGAKAPTGAYITLVVDARTMQSTDFGIGADAGPDPASALGPVTYLKGP